MPIEITGMSSSCTQASCESPQVSVARSEPTVAQQETGRPLTTETVTLSDTAQQLRSIVQTLASQPVVDSQRVDVVKQALVNGTYDLRAEIVAEKFISIEGQLAR